MVDSTKLETLLRRDGEDELAFAERAQAHVDARQSNGWQLQTRRDNGASIDLVFTMVPPR